MYTLKLIALSIIILLLCSTTDINHFLNFLFLSQIELKAEDKKLMLQLFTIHSQICELGGGDFPLRNDSALPSPPLCLQRSSVVPSLPPKTKKIPPSPPPKMTSMAPTKPVPCPDHLRAPLVYELIRKQNLQRGPDGSIQDGSKLVTIL